MLGHDLPERGFAHEFQPSPNVDVAMQRRFLQAFCQSLASEGGLCSTESCHFRSAVQAPHGAADVCVQHRAAMPLDFSATFGKEFRSLLPVSQTRIHHRSIKLWLQERRWQATCPADRLCWPAPLPRASEAVRGARHGMPPADPVPFSPAPRRRPSSFLARVMRVGVR